MKNELGFCRTTTEYKKNQLRRFAYTMLEKDGYVFKSELDCMMDFYVRENDVAIYNHIGRKYSNDEIKQKKVELDKARTIFGLMLLINDLQRGKESLK